MGLGGRVGMGVGGGGQRNDDYDRCRGMGTVEMEVAVV